MTRRTVGDATLLVRYPADNRRMLLRTELDWDRDVAPARDDGDTTEFRIPLPRGHGGLYYKPIRRDDAGEITWSTGANYLLSATAEGPTVIYPMFGAPRGSLGPRVRVGSEDGPAYDVRVYLPPGYTENPLKRYPVLYANDGANVFLAHEAFKGQDWGLGSTVDLLEAMAVIDKVVVVGIYAGKERARDYTSPGYEAYGRFVVDTLVPWVDASYRTLPAPASRAVIGASLGGVVSFYLAWEYPDVFAQAACLSSTFGWSDDLVARVLSEPNRGVRFYLDSGWPRDNLDATLRMADALAARGSCHGRDVLFFAFPNEDHSEKHWAARVHLPFQFFFGKAGRLACPAHCGALSQGMAAPSRGTS